MSTQPRDAAFVVLDAMIARGWGDVPQAKIPANWWHIVRERYDVKGLVVEAAAAITKELPAQKLEWVRQAKIVMDNERARRTYTPRRGWNDLREARSNAMRQRVHRA